VMTVQDLAVFPETVVLDVVQTVFDAPMPPYQVQSFLKNPLNKLG